MTPEQIPAPLVFEAPSKPPLGRTALAFVLAAVLLIGIALGYRSMGRGARSSETGMSHCFRGDYMAARAEHWGGDRLWTKAEAEYRFALRQNPRLSRARRGLAAILWLRGDAKGARATVTPDVDIPAERRDVWLATQVAYHAYSRPADAATRRRYKSALEAEDLGWSRLVALQALAPTKAEAARWRAVRTESGSRFGGQGAMAAFALLIVLSFLGGLAILIYSICRPWPNRIPGLPAPVGALVLVWAAGLAVQGFPALPVRWFYGAGFEKAAGDHYFAIVLAVHTCGALLALLLCHAALKQYKSSVRNIGWSFRLAPVWAIAGYLALVPVMVLASGISQWASRLFPNVETPVNSAELLVTSAHGWGLVMVFLTVCVVGPFVEELLFRGFLYRALSKPFGTMGGAVLSSAVFAAIHPQLPLGFLPIMCIGIGLCVVYRRSGSLTAAWLLHGLNNAMIMVMSLTVYGNYR